MKSARDLKTKRLTDSSPRYRVWTGGRPAKVLRDIFAYEVEKSRYLFWVDLSDKSTVWVNGVPQPCGIQATELLVYLATHAFGKRVSANRILAYLWGKRAVQEKVENPRVDRIERHIAKLNEITGDRFKQYLYRDRRERGYRLRRGFADQYFFSESRP